MNASNLQKRMERARRYSAAPGANFNDAEAQVIGEELDRLEGYGIAVTPENVLAAAVNPDSPLHSHFTWDDEIAADIWRKQEARQLISHLVVTIERDEEPFEVRARLSVVAKAPIEGPAVPQYMPTSTVLDTAALRQQILDQARRELKSWREKYERLGLIELEPIFRSVENWVD